jgi:hypothetical protein
MSRYKCRWTEEEDKILKENYSKAKKISDLLILLPDRTEKSLKDRARLFGLKYRIFGIKDEAFFDSPNVINCHIAGFIATDGCIQGKNYGKRKSNGRLVIELSTKDKEILEYIKKTTKSTHNIKDYVTPQHISACGRESDILCKSSILNISDMRTWGPKLAEIWNITPKKTLTLQPPNLTKYEDKLAYIQGVIEGDGCATFSQSLNVCGFNPVISITGTYDLLYWICQFMKEYFDKDFKPRKIKHSVVFELGICGAASLELTKEILKLPTYKMSRKWDKMQFIIDLLKELDNLGEIDKQTKQNFIESKYNQFRQYYLEKYNKELPVYALKND